MALWDAVEWRPFGEPLVGHISELEIGPDGALYAGGDFSSIGGVGALNIARFVPSTGAWEPLGNGLNGSVSGLTVSGDALFVSGAFTLADGVPARALARFSFASGMWSALGTGGEPDPFLIDAITFAAGSLYVGGRFTQVSSVAARNVARLNLSTGSWFPLGAGIGPQAGGFTNVYALAHDGTTLFAAGSFNEAGGVVVDGIAQWDSGTWSPVAVSPPLGADIGVRVLEVAPDGALYAGGEFTEIDGVEVRHLARWDGISWDDVAGGVPWLVRDLAFGAPGTGGVPLLVAGWLPQSPEGENPANYLRKWLGGEWSVVGGEGHDGVSGLVFALAHDSSSGVTYVGGEFEFAGATRAPFVGSRVPSGIFQGMAGGLDGRVVALEVGPGGTLYAGGAFAHAGGVPANRAAWWDGTSWRALGAGPGGGAQALAVSPDGSLYAGGSGVERWDGVTWQALGGPQGVTIALAIGPGGVLFAGGQFSIDGGPPQANVMRWDGTVWEPLLGLGVSPVRALVVGSDGMLYAGGNVGGVARWDGTTWAHLVGSGPALTGDIYALEFVGPLLFAAGTFGVSDGNGTSINLAQWDGTQWRGVTGGATGASIRALAWDGGGLFIGGDFGTVGSGDIAHPSVNLGRWVPIVLPGLQEGPARALGMRLLPAAPDPFRDRTRIQFEVYGSSPIRLTVYDAIGREVAVLHDAPTTQGRYEVVLNARAMPSGVYFVRLQGPGGTQARTVHVIR